MIQARLWTTMAVLAVYCVGLSHAASQINSDWEQRLSELRPDEPEAYFLLAEEIADVASSPEQVTLARRVFVLAFSLVGDDAPEAWIKPSVCIALADLERGEERERWLRALATRLDGAYGIQSWSLGSSEDADRETRLRLAEFVGLVRSGDGSLARDRLEYPGVLRLAEQFRDLPAANSGAASWSRLLTEAEVWPCPECANARSVVDPSDRETGRMLCPTCRGNPGPILTTDDLAASVAFEAVVLRSPARTWSAEAAVGRTEPLRDPDPDELAQLYGVDITRPIYRDGAWVSPPAGGD